MNLPDSWSDRSVKIPRASASEVVFQDLRGAIESGELVVGVKLPPEAALAERYGVSRSVVREALRSCATLGLTETRTGSGTFVIASRPVSPRYGAFSARDLIEARPYIEVPAAGWAARRRTDEQLKVMTGLLDRMDAETDGADWVRLDARLHLAIAEASGNDVFISVVGAIRGALSEQSRLLNESISERREASDGEHRRIVDAIAAGDYAHASDRMRQHLDRVEESVEALFGLDLEP
ncbi:FadR/GntR family transcriptional regulator [Tsukamurella sp. 8F]|uniref:FadR/GntR family transcriptional regulator n=1 Tax=unclassified Tsukamurella TaxID=2633480 RepID=UPI0023B920D2|nr:MULTISPECIES: FadR/GntR family transcriptional regulator [unclassified Tsukamurella]MDF0528500.1 FadR/GntR family transcriptional regulator [Tsukamurella sp. 8J]MDF0586326.1 FadR/GntR family transcriptional regulator [Tsukamurella sp. 8F]